MNKAQLIDQIAQDAEITKVQANIVLDCFTNAVIATLKKGNSLTLTRFGSFLVANRSARNGHNPQTGAVIKIKARKVAKFKPAKEFRDKIASSKTKK